MSELLSTDLLGAINSCCQYYWTEVCKNPCIHSIAIVLLLWNTRILHLSDTVAKNLAQITNDN
jgi:hypothetical protein